MPVLGSRVEMSQVVSQIDLSRTNTNLESPARLQSICPEGPEMPLSQRTPMMSPLGDVEVVVGELAIE